jgi:predicted MFS family arabinose efflux permease
MTSQPALNALNFFMADVRDGLGPFLGVYLQSENWAPSEIGLVMTIGALVGMAATAPLGALVDRIRAKRAMIVVSAVITVLASMIILFAPGFFQTAIAQGINGIAGAAIAPAIAGVTLGLVGQNGYAHQVGRNEAFNHAGNVTAAVLAGTLGYMFGIGAVFVVMAGMALASLIATWFINPKKIDHRAARGLPDKKHDGHAPRWSALATSKPLLVLAATLLLFHLGNAAMLPLLGQSLVADGAGDPSAFTGATVVVAQFTMVPMALLAARLAETRGYWIVFLLALLALPIRGMIAAVVTGPIGLGPVQVLDGVGAGLLGVAVPGLVARILLGTGHVNAGLGAVMTMQGVGAALSPALGGYVAEKFGYAASFMVLGAVALIALLLWVVTRPMTAEYGGRPD